MLEDKINDYKTFPSAFPNLLKEVLGIPFEKTPGKESEELEFRRDGITNIIRKFLSGHGCIASIEEISRGECEIYLFGSYLRKAVYRDIDLLVLYPNEFSVTDVDDIVSAIKKVLSKMKSQLDIQACSKNELTSLKMTFDNRVRVY